MRLKILQLNIEKGRFIDKIINFIIKENFDIINFQEVAGGIIAYDKIDCLQILKKSLSNYYWLRFASDYKRIDDENSYQGNAVFVKNIYDFEEEKVFWYKKFTSLTKKESGNFVWLPRNALAVKIKINNQSLWTISAHLPWTKRAEIESQARTELSGKIHEFIKSVNDFFVLTGDFNSSPATKAVLQFKDVSRNLIIENKIRNTVNSRTHRAADSIFPEGAAVDYIFISKNIKVNSFRVLENIDLSDHLGLMAEIEI